MAKTAKAKSKFDNQQTIVSGDCRQAIHWYTNMLAEESQSGFACHRGLFATNFEPDDKLLLDTALNNLEHKGTQPLVISGNDLYKQADYLWNLALNQSKYGQPVLTKFEEEIRRSQLLVLENLDTPLSAPQLWYLYHHVLYPAALSRKPMLIATPLGFEEFVMYGAGCDDFEYAGRRLTWEKVLALLNATLMNLYHCKQIQQDNLPAMLLPEYRFYKALQERHLSVTPHYVANDRVLDFAIINETAKLKLDVEIDFVHRFGVIKKDGSGLLYEQIKRDKSLIESGWQVLRFSAKELAGSLESCVDSIEELQRNSSKKSTVGRFVNLPMLTINQNLPAQDADELAAIMNGAGAAAIVGGAGTGKSTCVAHRIAFLLGQGVSPERILVLSYSAETIKPLKQAAEKIMPGRLLEKVNFYCWHDLGVRILKENVLSIKRKLPLKIEPNPQKLLPKLIAKYIKESDVNALELHGYPDEGTVAGIISQFKANLIGVHAARENARNDRELLVAKVYAAYEEQLQKVNKIDRDDMVSLAAQVLGQDADIRAHYENLFEHVIVDEHQDATLACDFIARVLACPNDNIIFVGNPDEALYESRAASPSLVAETSLRMPNADCYLLTHNWRSHPEITERAEQFLKNAELSTEKINIEKNTVTGWGEVPTKAIIGPFQLRDEAEQIDWIMAKIEELMAQGRKPEELAIICKTKDRCGGLEALLLNKGLLLGTDESDTNLLPDEESDVLTFLKLVADPDGPKSREYFERVCQLRLKGINPKLSATITDVAESFNVSYLKAVEFYSEAAADPFSTQLEQLVKRIRSMHRDKLSPYEIINLLKRPQWLGDYYKSIKLPARVAYEPLKIMSSVQDQARTYKTVAEFLKGYSPAKVSQDETNNKQGSLNLITILEAKGREFQVVFVPDLVENIYPDHTQINENDERRMFYVALTRARELLYLSCPKNISGQEVMPSKYLQQAGLDVTFIGSEEVAVENDIDELEVRPEEKVVVPEEIVFAEVPVENTVDAEILRSEPVDVEEPKESPVAKTTNIFGLISEENPVEIIEEFSSPFAKSENTTLSEIVLRARESKLNQDLYNPDITEDISKKIEVPIKRADAKEVENKIENRCFECQSILEPNARFCGECGAVQAVAVISTKKICKACGQSINMAEKFCGECGSPQ